MFVLALEIELHVPGARSLKERRRVVRPIIDRLRSRLPVAVADVGPQDLWQRAVLGVVAVGSTERQVVDLVDEAERMIWSAEGAEVTAAHRTWMEDDR